MSAEEHLDKVVKLYTTWNDQLREEKRQLEGELSDVKKERQQSEVHQSFISSKI